MSALLLVVYHLGFALWGVYIERKAITQDHHHAPVALVAMVPIVGLSVLTLQVVGLTSQLRSWLPFSYALALLLFLSLSVVAFALLLMRSGNMNDRPGG